MYVVGNARASSPAAPSWAGVDVGAKRGVIAYSARPLLCQRRIRSSLSRRSAVSRRKSGQLRSISTLPPAMRRLRAALASKNASTDSLCTVQYTSAVVVPLRSSSSRKNSATARACTGSENWRSVGNV